METQTISTEVKNHEQTTNDLIELAAMPKNQVKREIDKNYLQMLVENNPDLNKKDFVDFISKAQLTGADPRLNQIYLVVHNSWNSQKRTTEPKGTTLFAYQFFIRLAQQTGLLQDWGVDIKEDIYLDIVTGRKRPSLTATAWLMRKGQGRITYSARFWEFAKTDKDGNVQGTWKSMPYLMIEKCAVANVMRWAFPEVLGNFYVVDEMERVTSVDSVDMPKPNMTTVPTGPTGPSEVVEYNRDLEDMREIMMDLLQTADDQFFVACGKTRELMIEKVAGEKSPEQLSKMWDWLQKVKGNL